jgi:beta-lactamase class A
MVMRQAAVAALAAATTALAGCASASGQHAARMSASSPAPTSTTVPSTPPSTSQAPRPDYRAQLQAAIARLPRGSVSVAVLNLRTGARFDGGSTKGQWIASAYKLFLVEALLAKNGSMGGEEEDAELAIEHSDNAAGYRLFLALGGTSAVVAAFHRFGMTHTHLASDAYDPTFTTTSAMDYLKVVRALVEPGLLTASQRRYVIGLMRDVEPDQRWGVGAASTGWFVNKNGWISVDADNAPPEPADDDRWAVNSVGIVDRDGQRLLMAVLTQHNPDFESGVHLVERLAKLAGKAVTS